MVTTQLLIAMLVYPGVGLALGLGVLYTVLTTRRLDVRAGAVLAPVRSVEGIIGLVSMLLAGFALALLPWPFHPSPPEPMAWLWAWALFEGAFLLPLLPALLAEMPPVVRAASREAQIGVVGRAMLWIVLVVALLMPPDWSLVALPVHLLVVFTAIFALPAAVGWGPFAAEEQITPGGVAYGLDSGTAALMRASQGVRVAALLAASLLVLVPGALLVQPWISLVLVVGLFVLVSILLRRFAEVLPRLPLLGALRVCWSRALPLGLAAVAYFALINRL